MSRLSKALSKSIEKLRLDRGNKGFGAGDRPCRIPGTDETAFVIGHEAKILNLVERITMFAFKLPGAHKMLAEQSYQAVVRLDRPVGHFNARRDQRRVCHVEHGVISAIASTIGVLGRQEQVCCGQGRFRFADVNRYRVGHSRMPSRKMLLMRAGLLNVSGRAISSGQNGTA